MKFMLTYSFGVEETPRVEERFLDTGAPAPEGITMLGRWHVAGGRRGFLLVESEDATALFRYAAAWRDLLDLEILPIVADEVAAQVLGSIQRE